MSTSTLKKSHKTSEIRQNKETLVKAEVQREILISMPKSSCISWNQQ